MSPRVGGDSGAPWASPAAGLHAPRTGRQNRTRGMWRGCSSKSHQLLWSLRGWSKESHRGKNCQIEKQTELVGWVLWRPARSHTPCCQSSRVGRAHGSPQTVVCEGVRLWSTVVIAEQASRAHITCTFCDVPEPLCECRREADPSTLPCWTFPTTCCCTLCH